MKKIFVVLSVFAVLMFAVWAQAQTGSYGVTADGTYYVAKALVDKAEGSAPKVMYPPTWSKKAMTLVNGYYTYKAGDRKLRAGVKTEFCFDIGGNRYLPHALVEDSALKPGDFVDNGVGGYNFRLAPQ